MGVLEESKTHREIRHLLHFWERMDAKYGKLEVMAKDERNNPIQREMARCEQLGVKYEAIAKFLRFIDRNGISPILGFSPQTGALKFGHVGKHRKLEVKIEVRSGLLGELLREIPKLFELKKSAAEGIKPQRYLKPGEASKRLGVNYRTLWRWAKRGTKRGRKIKFRQLPSGRLLYPEEEIERVLREKSQH